MRSLGKVGLWTFALRGLDPNELKETVTEIEELGYGAVWFPGGPAESALRHAEDILNVSNTLAVASGIISIWAGDAASVGAGARRLIDEHGGRFVLGVGVSHPEAVNRQSPGKYRRPLAAMGDYLDALDAAGVAKDDRVLAALGPRMLEMAKERAAGAHPYFVPVEHTAAARSDLGKGPVIATEQAVVLDDNPARAREIARGHMALYLQLTNYTTNLRRFGFTDDDIANGGSDRLVDAIVAWGDAAAIARRVDDHLAAGADHVCLQVLGAEPRALPRAHLRQIAGAVFS